MNSKVAQALREQLRLCSGEIADIAAKLEKMDRFLEAIENLDVSANNEEPEKKKEERKETRAASEPVEEISSDAELVRVMQRIASNRYEMANLRQSYPEFVAAFNKVLK